MLWRLAGRLLTGPAAFFLAGLVDIGTFAFLALRETVRKRLGSLLRRALERGSDLWR